MSRSKIKQALGALLVIGVILAYRHFTGQTLEPAPADPAPTARTERTPATSPPVVDRSDPAPSRPTPGRSGSATASVDDQILQAFRQERSDLWFVSAGTVDRVLRDDNEGSRHQRFIIELSNGHTVLVAHNIDLAPRVPLAEGDAIEFRGEYEWNDRGGVIHWTHHDPRGRREGGWLRHEGRVYE